MKKAPLTKKTRQRNRAPSNGTDFDTSQLLSALMAFKRGDFSARLPEDWTGVSGKVADTFKPGIGANCRLTPRLDPTTLVVANHTRTTHTPHSTSRPVP